MNCGRCICLRTEKERIAPAHDSMTAYLWHCRLADIRQNYIRANSTPSRRTVERAARTVPTICRLRVSLECSQGRYAADALYTQ